MGEGPVSQEADETRALKALQIPPPLVVGNTGRLALLGEGGLTLENRVQPIIARESLLVRGGITEKEIKLQ